MVPFQPLVRNPHLLTILGNFWPRTLDTHRFPEQRRLFQTEPDVQVLVISQKPEGRIRGQIVLVHGLEGSSDAGYKRSLAQRALEAGFAVHRFNMRSCGGTENLALTNYHAGQTSDLLFVLRELATDGPIFLVGFSLGGNVSLKLAGELGETDLIAGVCAVSTPLDLGACVENLKQRRNIVYSRRFLSRLKSRIKLRVQQAPDRYSAGELPNVKTVYDFDHLYTARLFGFGTADRYYGTQSSKNFLDRIRVPALIIQAKDDPLIPFSVYDHPAFKTNPNLTLLAVEHGGHVGFIAKGPNRFWLDGVVVEWAKAIQSVESRNKLQDSLVE